MEIYNLKCKWYFVNLVRGFDTKFPGFYTEFKYLFWDNISSHTLHVSFYATYVAVLYFCRSGHICSYVFYVGVPYSITCLRHVLYLCYTCALICFYTYITICIFIYKYLFQDSSWKGVIIIFCFNVHSDVVFQLFLWTSNGSLILGSYRRRRFSVPGTLARTQRVCWFDPWPTLLVLHG